MLIYVVDFEQEKLAFHKKVCYYCKVKVDATTFGKLPYTN
jgi:hypothetical protein